MGGGQDAHVHLDLALAADRAHGFFLNRAQQLHLHGQRQVADFVEKQRAAVGGLEQAVLVRDRAGEAAFAVAEEFAFHQALRDRAAVDRHERLVGARTQFVDQARDQFLAGAGFAVDVDRRLAARELFDQRAHLLDGRRFAQQFLAACWPVWLSGFAAGLWPTRSAERTMLRRSLTSSGLETKSNAPALSAVIAVSMLP